MLQADLSMTQGNRLNTPTTPITRASILMALHTQAAQAVGSHSQTIWTPPPTTIKGLPPSTVWARAAATQTPSTQPSLPSHHIKCLPWQARVARAREAEATLRL